MSNSDAEGVVFVERSYGTGQDIFGKYDLNELMKDGTIDHSTDDDEEDEHKEDEEEEDEDEENIHRNTKV